MTYAVYRSSIEAAPSSNLLHIQFDQVDPVLSVATVTVPASIVNLLYHETAVQQKNHAQTRGFAPGTVPLEYVQQHFKTIMVEHLKEFLLKFCVSNYLYEQIRLHKLVVTDEPRLTYIYLEPGHDAIFRFECTCFNSLFIHDWKYLPFKAPKRKNYKDIDRQVDAFIKMELDKYAVHEARTERTIEAEDWVNFNVSLANQEKNLLIEHFEQNFWLKLKNDEVANELCLLFIGKKKGDSFVTPHSSLQDYFSNQLELQYLYKIEIVDVLPYSYFCLDQFKQQFKTKTNKDMHKKLIEAFSYSNDISLRRTIIEETFRLLLHTHPFDIPKHCHLRQQRILLEAIQQNPDYDIYRIQKDFTKQILQLAENQAKEAVFADHFAYHENIDVTHGDVCAYLNLYKRPKMKEFVYFSAPSSKINSQEVPIHTEELKRTCLREKALNYAIFHLTKNR